jgi:hypothetical protein
LNIRVRGMAADGHSVEKLRGYLRGLKPEARALLLAELERKQSHGDGVPGFELILQELRTAAGEASPQNEASFAPEAPAGDRDEATRKGNADKPQADKPQADKPQDVVADPTETFLAFFEPFIVDDAPDYEHPGRIARGSLTQLWEWICRDLVPQQAETYSQAFAQAAKSGDSASITQAVRSFQDCAARAIDQAIAAIGSDDKSRRRLMAQIGTPQALQDAHLAGSLLKSRDVLGGMATRLPPKIRSFADDQLDSIKALLDTVIGRNKALFVLALVLVRSKLAAPWQLIRLATKAADSDVATKISETPYSLAVNIVLAETERLVRLLTNQLKRGQADQVTAVLKEIHDAARGLRTEMDLASDSPWARRLTAVRAEIAALLKDPVESMPGRVRRLLRPRSAKEIVPGSKLDEGDVDEADALIGFVGACRNYAGELAINEMTLRAYSELQHYLEANTQTLIDGLRTATPAERVFRQSQVDAVVRFCAKVFGQEYAGLLAKSADVAANSERKAAGAKA